MTRDEIMKLEAGREMDALVYKNVFGKETATVPPRAWDDGYCFEDTYYSTDISAAWEVVEKIRSWGNGWCPQIYWDDNDGLERGCWVAEFNKYWKVENDYRHHKAIADTAALAICRAALIAEGR